MLETEKWANLVHLLQFLAQPNLRPKMGQTWVEGNCAKTRSASGWGPESSGSKVEDSVNVREEQVEKVDAGGPRVRVQVRVSDQR